MGRYVISLCVAALVVGFVFLLTSLGMTGSGSQSTLRATPSGAPELGTLAPGFTGRSEALPATASPPVQPPADRPMFDPYGKPSPPELGAPSPEWSLGSNDEDLDLAGPAGDVIVLHQPAPIYPDRCRTAADGKESVTVGFDVDDAGYVVNPKILASSNACFNATAIRTIGKWRFAAGRPAQGLRKAFIFSKDR